VKTAFLFLLAWLLGCSAAMTYWAALRLDRPVVVSPSQVARSAIVPAVLAACCLLAGVFL